MASCTTSANRSDYVSDYNASLEPASVDAPQFEYPVEFETLIKLFTDLKSEQVSQLVEETYSSNLYFNDTLHTFTDRDQLAKYLIEGAQRVDDISISFYDVASSGDNHYIRWLMQMKLRVMGKSIDSKSIGISQIRFDEAGKINFHQDFWANTTGFFGPLPVLGGLISRIKASMR